MGHPFYPVASPLLCPIHESQSPVLAHWRDGIMYGGSCARNSRGFRRLTTASSSSVINVISLQSPATSSSSHSPTSPSPLWPRSSFLSSPWSSQKCCWAENINDGARWRLIMTEGSIQLFSSTSHPLSKQFSNCFLCRGTTSSSSKTEKIECNEPLVCG